MAKVLKEGSVDGRPTKYDLKYNEQARKLCLLGYTDAELANFFEVSESTINLWKKEYPDFSESIWKGRDGADAEITASLYERARGYSHPDVVINTFQGEVIKTEVTKHYPPDTKAATIWLSNRQGRRWRDKQDVQLSGTVHSVALTKEETKEINKDLEDEY